MDRGSRIISIIEKMIIFLVLVLLLFYIGKINIFLTIMVGALLFAGSYFKFKYYHFLLVFAMVIVSAFFYREILNGLILFINHFRQIIMDNFSLKLLPFQLIDLVDESTSINIFSCVVSFLLYLQVMSLAERNPGFLLFEIYTLFAFSVLIGVGLHYLSVLSLVLVTFIVLNSPDYKKFFYTILMVGLIGTIGFFMGEHFSREGAFKPTLPISNSITSSFDNYRYSVVVVPGDLNAKVIKEEEVEFEITMSKPESVYLRSFIGKQYHSNGLWEYEKKESKGKSVEVLSALEREGFDPNRQLYMLGKLLSLPEVDSEIDVAIRNISANRKYYLLPYELISYPDNKNQINNLPTSFYGAKGYKYKMSSELISNYPKFASTLYDKKNDSLITNYLNSEELYRSYIDEYYLDVPEEDERIIKIYLGEKRDGEVEHRYEKTKEEIEEFLTENLEYEDAVEIEKKDNLTRYLLEKNAKADDRHYASLATLIFRYAGIPARYVEGYIITPEDIQSLNDYESLKVTGKSKHAWCEIYVDLIGWIPLEFSPSHKNRMTPIDMSYYPTDSEVLNKEKVFEKLDNDELEKENEYLKDDSTQEENTYDTRLLLYILIGALLLIVVLIIGIYEILYRRKRNRRVLDILKNDRKSHHMIISDIQNELVLLEGKRRKYFSSYCENDLLEEEISNLLGESLSLYQDSYYGGKTLSEEEFNLLIGIRNKLAGKCKKKLKFLSRINHRYLVSSIDL